MGETTVAFACPTIRRPNGTRLSSACLRRLDPEDIELLEQMLSQKHDFVDDPCLDEQGIEVKLFSKDFDETVVDNLTANGFPTVPARFVKLTADQERVTFLQYNLARKHVVQMLSRHSRSKSITPGVGRRLVQWHRRVLAIRSEIVNANFPLVLAMAKHSRFSLLDINEMISEGNMALLRSINRYDLTKGYRFSSYACRSILKAFSRVAMRTGRYRHLFPTEYDESMERSDDAKRRRDDDREGFLDMLQAVLTKNAAHLNNVERLVIMKRFALENKQQGETEPKTLGEVGQMIGLTKERVRQIQNRALEKLRIAMANRFAAA